MRYRNWHEVYRAAEEVQDACNLSAVVLTLKDVTEFIWEEIRMGRLPGGGTEAVNQHPTVQAIVGKLVSLSVGGNTDRLNQAYSRVGFWLASHPEEVIL